MCGRSLRNSYDTARASGRASRSCCCRGSGSTYWRRCSAGSARTARADTAEAMLRFQRRTARALWPRAWACTAWSQTRRPGPKSTAPRPSGTRRLLCMTRPCAWFGARRRWSSGLRSTRPRRPSLMSERGVSTRPLPVTRPAVRASIRMRSSRTRCTCGGTPHSGRPCVMPSPHECSRSNSSLLRRACSTRPVSAGRSTPGVWPLPRATALMPRRWYTSAAPIRIATSQTRRYTRRPTPAMARSSCRARLPRPRRMPPRTRDYSTRFCATGSTSGPNNSNGGCQWTHGTNAESLWTWTAWAADPATAGWILVPETTSLHGYLPSLPLTMISCGESCLASSCPATTPASENKSTMCHT